MIGVTLGLNQFSVNTSDFEAKPGSGWNVGLSMRGNFYNNWERTVWLQRFQYDWNNIRIKSIQRKHFRF